jgi:hypothetical protein
LAETETHFASPASASASFSTSAAALPVLDGRIRIQGSTVVGSTLAVNTGSLTSTPPTTIGTLSFEWRRNGVTITDATTPFYTTVAADIGYNISVVVRADNCSGSLSATPVGPITKQTQAAPGEPTLESATAMSITLNMVIDCEYSIDNGATWQTETLFDGLTPNASYTFTQRYIETEIKFPSPASAPATFSTITDFVPVTDITDVPTTALVDVLLTLTGTVVPSDATHKSITWSVQNAGTTGATISKSMFFNATGAGLATVKATIKDGIAPGTPYTQEFYIDVTKQTQTAPDPPTLLMATETSIILTPLKGHEVSIDGGATWQIETLFEGLTPNTAYTFVARKAETTMHTASPASLPATFSTL